MKAILAWITTHKPIAILVAVAVILTTVGTIVAINSANSKPPVDDASGAVVTTTATADATPTSTTTISETAGSSTTAGAALTTLTEKATETTKDGATTAVKPSSTTKLENKTDAAANHTTTEKTNATTKATAVPTATQTPTAAATRHYCSQYMQWTVNKLPENGGDGYLEQRCSICGWTWSKVLPGFSSGKTATHAEVQEYAMQYLQSKGCITKVIDDPWEAGGFNPPMVWGYGQPFDEEMKESIRNCIDYEIAYYDDIYLTAYASAPEYDQSGYTDPQAGWLYIVYGYWE